MNPLQNMHAPDYVSGCGLKPSGVSKRGGFLRGRFWWFDVLMLVLFFGIDAYAIHWFLHRGVSQAVIDVSRSASIAHPVSQMNVPKVALTDNELCVGGSVIERSKAGGTTQFVQLLENGRPVACAGRNRY